MKPQTDLHRRGSPWLSRPLAASGAGCVGAHRAVPLPGHRSDPREAEIHDADRTSATEKIMEAATGDKDFWIVDVVGNFCFVHPAKAGISSNLNLITDKGNIYSFTLTDVSDTDARTHRRPEGDRPPSRPLLHRRRQRPAAVRAGRATGAVEAAARRGRIAHHRRPSMSTRAPIRFRSSSTTRFHANEAPFDIEAIYHDDKFTYIKTDAPEKFSIYDMRDGKPNLVTYQLENGTYIIPEVMDSGYVELGKKRMDFSRKG